MGEQNKDKHEEHDQKKQEPGRTPGSAEGDKKTVEKALNNDKENQK